MKILVIQGEGLDVRGQSKVEIFGPESLAEINQKILDAAESLDMNIEIVQSNIVEEVVELLAQVNPEEFSAVLINPGGFTIMDTALPDAIAALPVPVYEVHGSNPAARGITSKITPVCRGVICGFGYDGYGLALQALQKTE